MAVIECWCERCKVTFVLETKKGEANSLICPSCKRSKNVTTKKYFGDSSSVGERRRNIYDMIK